MNSQIINFGKKLIVLTLIAGFLLMPVAPILAEETLALASSTPVEVAISPEPVVVATSTPVIIVGDVASDTCPVVASAVASIEGTNTAPLSSSEPLVIVAPLEQKALASDLFVEDSFTTALELPIDEEKVALSDELSFTTITGDIGIPDNMAISDENPFGDNVVVIDPSIGVEGQWETLPEEGVDNTVASTEGNFTTTSTPDEEEDTVSGENFFTTVTPPTEDHLTVSAEQSFYTLSVPALDPAISAEQSFVTLPLPTDEVTASDEGNFITLKGDDHTDSSVSEEHSFTTMDSIDNSIISDEMSFTTLGIPNVHDVTISDEMSFTTLGTPDNHDTTVSEENSFTTEAGSSGCTSNCGGSGGGGGGGSSVGQVLGEKTYYCEILLYKFIRLGQTNDRREVMKLQAFLKVYEGFKNLRITGVYDMPTYRAVEIFQKRYRKDILGPWKISDSTGYVYITTRIAINNIFCGRDTTNNTDLRDEFYREYEAASGEKFPTGSVGPATTSTDAGYFITSTTTEATSTSVVKKSWILASLGGLFGFVGDNLCWLLNLFLLLIILFLLWLLWLVDRDSESTIAEEEQDNSSVDLMGLPADKLEEDTDVFRDPIVNSSIGMVGAVALEELMTEDDQVALADLAEEEDSQIPAANNDPDQEQLLTKL